MKKIFISLSIVAALFSLNQEVFANNIAPSNETVETLAVPTEGKKVTNAAELSEAIKNAKPGDNIIMANGVWKDVGIVMTNEGTEDKPITLAAEEAGKVFLEGKSYLQLGGKHIIVCLLYTSPSPRDKRQSRMPSSA